jgi:high potential iron-sulfur protein
VPNNDHSNESRRRFLKAAAGTAAVAAAVGLLPNIARAADLPHLSPAEPTAAALSYVEDASKSTNAARKPGDVCANCQFFQGKPADAFAPCQLFPGKAVAGKGWCVSHSPKAA